MNRKHFPKKHTDADIDTLIRYQTQLHQAAKSPWLAALLLKRAYWLRARLSYFYQQITSLPRRWRRRLQKLLAAGLVGAALLLAFGPTPSVHAASISVTPGAAGINSGDGCSLVEAITNANNNAATYPECNAGSGADTITLAGGVYSYTTAYGANSALPDITSSITIEANNATIERSGGADFRLIRVTPSGNLTLNQAAITGGEGFGGLYNQGTLTVNNSDIYDNENNSLSGGGITNKAGSGNATLIINNSSVTENSVSGTSFGGGISNESVGSGTATVTVTNSTISHNSGGDGAGLGNKETSSGSAQLTLNNSTVSGNQAVFGSGPFGTSDGGGLYNGSGSSTITLNRTIVTGNIARGNGAEVRNAGGTINANNYNLFGQNTYNNADSFSGFTPSGSDINGSNGGAGLALTSILEKGARDRGTWSHRLIPGSPAIDAIPASDPGCNPGSSLDQHGGSRANGAGAGGDACDIGAFEYDSAVPGNNITVDPGAEGIQPGDGCSLVEAILNANHDNGFQTECYAGAGEDTIILAGNTYTYANPYGTAAALPDITSVLTIEGNGATIERGDGAATPFQMLLVTLPGDLTLNYSTISGGDGDGGAGLAVLYGDATLNNSVITENGNRGIYIIGDMQSNPGVAGSTVSGSINTDWGSIAHLTLNNTTVSNNYTAFRGGGIRVTKGQLTIDNSTISGNFALGTGNSHNDAGGIGFEGSYVQITNSTISGNTAITAAGLGNLHPGSLVRWEKVILDNVTITGNQGESGIGIYVSIGDIEIRNSIISGNTSWLGTLPPSDIVVVEIGYAQFHQTHVTISNTLMGDSGRTTEYALSYHLINGNSYLHVNDSIFATSDGDTPTALDAILDTTLADNGGPTLTHALVLGSPAIDLIAIDGLHCDPPNSTDQRGAARANGTNAGGTACDAGAFELSGESPTAVSFHNASANSVEYPAGIFAAVLAALSAVTVGFWRRFKSAV